MRHRLVAFAFVTLLSASAAAQQPVLTPWARSFLAVDTPLIALTHVTLIDGTGAPARNDQTIVLRDGRIESVGESSRVTLPAAAKVVDLAGYSLIPGLVGLHQHTYLGGITPAAPMMHSAMLYLASGVTTAMTAGSFMPYSELNIKRMIDTGDLPGPRMHIAGPYLTGPRAVPGPFRIIDSLEQATRVVNYWADEGATWFKILNGPAAVVRAVVSAAHARGLKVTAHLCAVTSTEAAQLGVDALQHGFITNSEYVPGEQPDVCPGTNQRAQADVDPASAEVRESIRADRAGKVRMQRLDRDHPSVSRVAREPNGGHTAPADRALNCVAITNNGSAQVIHSACVVWYHRPSSPSVRKYIGDLSS